MLLCSTNEEQKNVASWGISDTLATQSSLVHDVIDTDCWAQNDSTHVHIVLIFGKHNI